MYWRAILIAICFVVSVAFIVTMAFVSPFFKIFLQTKPGLVLNLIWLMLLIVVFATTAISTDRCLSIEGTKGCMRNVVMWVVVSITLLMITYIVAADIAYRIKSKDSEKK